jgi:hypothetical protein
MSDIADFLRARYAERRSIAEAAAALQDDPENGWVIVDPGGYAAAEKRRWIAPHIGVLYEVESAEHAVANNPAVVLADLDAKLAIVDLMERTIDAAEGDTEVDHYGGLSAAEETLCRLAQPFAGHPDHKGEEWAP